MNNFYLKAIGIFVATGIGDFVWAKYIASITTSTPLIASTWATITLVLGAFVVISYVQDKRMLIPAAIGAFIGTYLAV